MTVALVVDAVHLRALEQVAEDVRGAQVRVVEHLAERSEHDVVGAGLDADAHHHVGDEAAQQRVEDHLGRMLVEGGEYLDALRRVVQLVEQPPERVVGVARAMPPVGDEGVDEVGGEAASSGGRASEVCSRLCPIIHLFQVMPASRAIDTWTMLRKITRATQVLTLGNFQPGTNCSSMKMNSATPIK